MDTLVQTILLVEDEALIAMGEKRQLEKLGYSVHHVLTGEAAVASVREGTPQPDLILMDIDLGSGIDGTQAAGQILAEVEIPVVFLSSHTEPEVVEKTEKITSYGYVVKNSGITVLDASIKMAMRLFDAKQRVEESEEEYRRLFETMSTGVVYQARDGAVVAANPAAERILGSTLAEMQGLTSMDPRWKMIDEEGIYVPGDQHPVMLALEAGETIGPVERGVFVPETNRYVWLLITATPLFRPGEETPYQSYATIDDITERREIERALIDQEHYLETILETTVDGFWVVMMDGTISMTNDAYCRMSGYSRDELIGMYANEIELADDMQETFERFERVMNTGSEIFETQHRRKDGTVFDVEVSLSRLDRSDDICLIGFLRDITVRKRADQETKNQLLEKETLLKEVHHRIKNNMIQVESLLSIQADLAESAEVKTALMEGMSRIQIIRALYEKLLIGTVYEEISMKDYLESLIDSIEEVFSERPGVTVEKNLVDLTLSSKRAVPVGIILNELLTNVFKYAFEDREAGRVTVVLEKTGTQASLTVEDDGIGFDQQSIADKTTGFGLSIVNMLVEQLEGTFAVHSPNGTRSVVTFGV